MSASLVVDSPALVPALSGQPSLGDWVRRSVEGAALAAPHLALYEAANVLRRLARSDGISCEVVRPDAE